MLAGIQVPAGVGGDMLGRALEEQGACLPTGWGAGARAVTPSLWATVGMAYLKAATLWSRSIPTWEDVYIV
jgi:hypothetical protein